MTKQPTGRSGALARRTAALTGFLLILSGLSAVTPAAAAPTPQTVVSLTFDDGNADQMTAAQIMSSAGLAGTFFIPSSWVGAPGYLTRTQLGLLAAAGNEIGGHTVNHADLVALPPAEATRQACQGRATLAGWGFQVTSFAYPFASVNTAAETIVKDCGFNSARGLGDIESRFGCQGCGFSEATPPADPYYTRALDQTSSSWTLNDLQQAVINAENSGGGWVQYTFHHICDNACDPLSVTSATFQQFTQWLAARAATNNTVVRTVDQVIGGTVKPVVSTAGTTPPAAPPGVNGIKNPSLEQTTSGGIPQCWMIGGYGSNSPVFSRTSPGHTGTAAERIVMTGYVDGDAKLLPAFDLGTCSPTVTPGHTYSLRAWYQSTTITQFAVYLRNDSGYWSYWTSSPWLAASQAYTEASWQAPTIPAGFNGISFGLSLFSNGVLVTDDYGLYEDVGAPIPAQTLTTAIPTITGTAQVGQTLTANPGVWGPGTVDLTFQWIRAGVAIPGATGATYTLVGADSGHPVSVSVSGTKLGYNPATTASASTLDVAAGVLTSAKPTITGTPKVGQLLTALPGSWSPNPIAFDYQWLRDGLAIAGAVSATYTPTGSDNGSPISVRVTGSATGYQAASTTSDPTTIAAGDFTTALPTISGVATVGQTLSAEPGSWVPGTVTFSYQWLRTGLPIATATGSAYTLTQADLHTTVSVRVTGTAPGYTPVSRTSISTSPVALGTLTSSSPAISGAPQVGTVVTANPGTWDPSTVNLTYRWWRNGLPIRNATYRSYTVKAADLGTMLTVTVTGNAAGYVPVSVTSATLGPVVAGHLNAAVPAISGFPQVGRTLTADAGDWGQQNVAKTYQWWRNGARIAGATSRTYTMSAADVDGMVAVSVTGTKAGYTPATATSPAFGPVRPGTLTASEPTINGTAEVGNTLTAIPGRWGPGSVTLTYQWLRDGVPVAGATGKAYQLTETDRGIMITVSVTGTKPGYLTTTRTSASSLHYLVLAGAATPVDQPANGPVALGREGTLTGENQNGPFAAFILILLLAGAAGVWRAAVRLHHGPRMGNR